MVVNARTDSDNILQLVSIFVDRGANVNHRMNRHYFFIVPPGERELLTLLTPLDRFNNRYNVHNNYRLAADIIRAAGGKCLSTCLTVNGVRDITLAPVSFSPSAVTALTRLSTTVTAGKSIHGASGETV